MSTLERPAEQESGLSNEPRSKTTLVDPGSIERTIKPSRGWMAIDWNELYQSRELFDTMILRDIKIRYKQTVLGVGWAVLQPLATMTIFTLVFGSFEGVKPIGIPYPLFVLAGLVPWTFFTNAVSSSGMSLLNQQHMLSKIYFPRLYIPASTAGAYLVDMAIGLCLFGVMLPFFRYVPSINLVFLPFAIVLTFAAALGLGLIFASMTILYRDLRFVIPFMMQVMMYASPLFFQPKILPRPVQLLVSINPMSGIITTFRWCILGLPLDIPSLIISVVVTICVLIFGLFFFRKTERFFTDIV